VTTPHIRDASRRRGLQRLAGPARAQQPKMSVIGYLASGSPGLSPHLLTAFRQTLAEAGYIDGQNVTLEYRYAEGRYDRLPEFAAGLADRQVAVIVASPHRIQE
jgi:putative ABC transport system substrate-binding protein